MHLFTLLPMRFNLLILLSFLLLAKPGFCFAQRHFVEGTITYKVQIETTDKKEVKGTYVFTFKNGLIRKDLKLNNGYEDIVLINTLQSTAYSLQVKNGKKVAIQLNVDELNDRQKKYMGFRLKEDGQTGKMIAGYAVHKGAVHYNDGSSADIYYTTEWCPDKALTYERFPEATFLPLFYTFKNEGGIELHMEAESIKPAPVENSVFMVPADCRIISYSEYKNMNRR